MRSRKWRAVTLAILVSAAAGYGASAISSPGPRDAAPMGTAPVAQMGLLGGQAGWADSCQGLYLTDDFGAGWTRVTPANLSGVSCVSDHITSVASFGATDLWIAVSNVPWLGISRSSCQGCVNPPGSGIDRTTDGGRSWSFRVPPGCGTGCGVGDLDFVDATHGVMDGVYTTSDGGSRWTFEGYDTASGGQGLVLSRPGLAWQISGDDGPLGGSEQLSAIDVAQPGHCTDCSVLRESTSVQSVAPRSGAMWSYALPTFFNEETGVAPARQYETAGGLDRLVVFATEDGGRTWSAHSGPAGVDLAGYPPGTTFDLPFSATSATAWELFVGPSLYQTVNAGRTWSVVKGDPTWSAPNIWSVDFSSSTNGWVIVARRACSFGICNYTPSLFATTNGGRNWRQVSP